MFIIQDKGQICINESIFIMTSVIYISSDIWNTIIKVKQKLFDLPPSPKKCINKCIYEYKSYKSLQSLKFKTYFEILRGFLCLCVCICLFVCVCVCEREREREREREMRRGRGGRGLIVECVFPISRWWRPNLPYLTCFFYSLCRWQESTASKLCCY